MQSSLFQTINKNNLYAMIWLQIQLRVGVFMNINLTVVTRNRKVRYEHTLSNEATILNIISTVESNNKF